MVIALGLNVGLPFNEGGIEFRLCSGDMLETKF